jgi:polyphosphate kinase 2 (PPK2 family)
VTGNNKIYTKYKRLIELLNLRQLDVYRVEGKDGKIKEIVRLLDPTTRKVANVDLNTVRESLSYIEFLNKIKEGVSKEGININDRVWNSTLKLLNKNK